AQGRVRLEGTSAPGAGIRRPWRAGTADLGRHRLDPLQPAATTGAGAMSGWNTLVSVEELSRELDAPGLVVVDCRFSLANPEAGAVAHAQAHVPGAGDAHLGRDLADRGKQGQSRPP